MRWHLHELDSAWDPPQRSLNRYKQLDEITAWLAGFDGLVARLALEITHSVRSLTVRINDLERELTALVRSLAPTLLTRPGIAPLTTAKISARPPTSHDSRARTPTPPHRHRPAAGVVRKPHPTPPAPIREQATQLRPPSHRHHPKGRCHPDPRAFIELRHADNIPRDQAS